MRRFIYLLLIVLVAANSACRKKSELPSLQETYSKDDKNPFGSFVLYKQLQQGFPNNYIHTKKDRFQITESNTQDTAALYFNISKNFFIAEEDQQAILKFVSLGNSMFIASENIDTSLLSTWGFSINNPGAYVDGVLSYMKYTSVSFYAEANTDSAAYSYFFSPFQNHFISDGNSLYRVLGKNEQGKANFIVVFHGKGRIYFHCEPRALSNYFLLRKNNLQYFQNAFALLPASPENIYWDDYYNKKNSQSKRGANTGLQALLQYPGMKWALSLMLLLMALYLLLGGKRKQRIVPEVLPTANNTVAFTETIGRLYLQKKDNLGIAEKMVTYFLEHVRNQYYLNTHNINEEFINALTRKAVMPRENIERLCKAIIQVQQANFMEDQQLISLNQQIEKFYKTIADGRKYV